MAIKDILTTCVLVLVCTATHAQVDAQRRPVSNAGQSDGVGADGRRDFDFLMGRWTVDNTKLLKPLHNDSAWEEFGAVNVASPLLGGMGNFDEFRAERWRPGFVGTSLRFFNPADRQWSIFWVDNRSVTVGKPVVGRFVEGVGVFEGDDTIDGRPIRVRFLWNVKDRAHPRWEQAFSADDGKTWETNWIMRFSRPAALATDSEKAR